MNISSRTFTLLLFVIIIVLSFQTYSLYALTHQLNKAQIGIGNSNTVSFTNDDATPDMVGGC